MELMNKQEIAAVNGGNPISISLAITGAAYAVAAGGFAAGWRFAVYLEKNKQ